MTRRVWTIGYERLLAEALVAELRAAGVRRVIDVRQRPQSRRAGMSKSRLAERLAGAAIDYEHRRALGTPPDIRFLFRSGSIEDGRRAFRAHVERHEAAALRELADELSSAAAPPTALLCLEADPERCHRRVICEALAERVPGLDVVDL